MCTLIVEEEGDEIDEQGDVIDRLRNYVSALEVDQ